MTEDTDDGVSPEAAFGLVANETRFSILQALWEARNDEEIPVPFSTLRRAAGVRDSGQFNYHLGELVPRFVRDEGDGYDLTYAGTRVVGAAVSGVYTEAEVTSLEPTPVGDCLHCGGRIEATYSSGLATIECADCEVVVTDGLSVPPVLATAYEPEDLPMVFSRVLVTQAQTVSRGFCHLCGGRVETTLSYALDEAAVDDARRAHDVTDVCLACGRTQRSVVGAVLLDHPKVAGFLYDHGVDLRETPMWEFDWLFEPHARITSEDPIRVAVEITLGGETLELTVDEKLTVLDHERV